MLGDLTGFAALALVALSAFLMVERARLVRLLGSPDRLRGVHVAVSVLAAAFLSAHIALLYLPPGTFAVDAGYAAFGIGLLLWGTGVGFLERNRDSFVLHGSLSIALIATVVVHAAAGGVNFPPVVAAIALVAVGAAALLNAGYYARKLLARGR